MKGALLALCHLMKVAFLALWHIMKVSLLALWHLFHEKFDGGGGGFLYCDDVVLIDCVS